jgi:hypothetical protein
VMRSPARRAAAAVMFALTCGLSRTAVAEPVEAQRVTVVDEDGQLVIRGVQSVRKTLAPSDELPSPSAAAGAWYQLEASDGRVLYRRLLHGVFGEWCDGTRHAVPAERQVMFTAVVPACPGECDLVVFSSADTQVGASAGRGLGAAVERGRIRLPPASRAP